MGHIYFTLSRAIEDLQLCHMLHIYLTQIPDIVSSDNPRLQAKMSLSLGNYFLTVIIVIFLLRGIFKGIIELKGGGISGFAFMQFFFFSNMKNELTMSRMPVLRI